MKKIFIIILSLVLILGIAIGIVSCHPTDQQEPTNQPTYTISVTAPDTVGVSIKKFNEDKFVTFDQDETFTVSYGDFIKIENAPQFTTTAIEGKQFTLIVGLENTDTDNIFKVVSNVKIYVSLAV